MIGFFRKIRKKLADDNKPMKYMRYAIGEILLVVIGILIALQINNWNEERKNDVEMIEILKGLEKEFQIELSSLGHRAIRYDSMFVRSARILIPSTDEPFSDAVLKSGMASILWAGTHDTGAGALESLIASGKMGLIKNKKLSTDLANWNSVVEETQDNEIGMRDYVFREIVPRLSELGLYDLESIAQYHNLQYWSIESELNQSVLTDVLDDNKFKSLALYRMQWLSGSKDEFRATVNSCKMILDSIRSELKKH